MKGTIAQLSTETQNTFKVMQGELVAMDNLLAKCEMKLTNSKDVGKKIEQMAQSANSKLNSVKVSSGRMTTLACQMSDKYYDKVQKAAHTVYNEAKEALQPSYAACYDQADDPEKSALALACKELC